MTTLVSPHGGKLTPLFVDDSSRAETLSKSDHLTKVNLSTKEISDVIMLGIGAFSPLKGFLGKKDYERVVAEMRLETGLLWPVPITVAVSKQQATRIRVGKKIALTDPERNEIMATMLVSEKYSYDKREEACMVFGTDDAQHPGVSSLYKQDDVYLGGTVTVLSEGQYPDRFPEFARPAETRATFAGKGWRNIAAFQTRNPMHRSHEYLAKIALEICDGLFLHPIVGRLKSGDIPAEVRMECYRALLNNYFPKDRVVLAVYPMEMRYAGPREAVLHAIIRQNFGCSHLIVGRDHAGVGSFYAPFEAQDIFNEFKTNDLQIRPLKLDWAFWCTKCDGMASLKTCPHSAEDRLLISGTKLRDLLATGETIPEKFSRKEVLDILIEYYSKAGAA